MAPAGITVTRCWCSIFMTSAHVQWLQWAKIRREDTQQRYTHLYWCKEPGKCKFTDRNTNAMNSWLRWSWHAWRGRNPWLSSYWTPARAITQSQPIGWVPWERVLQEEGRPSPGPTWRVPITSGTYCRCQHDIVASHTLPVVIKVTTTGRRWNFIGSEIPIRKSPFFFLPSWNWMQPCSRGPHLWPALTSQVKGLRDRGAYWETRL